MNQPSFLARKTGGIANYFLIALLLAFVVALIPRGVRRAVQSNTNNAKDWLPPSYAESVDLTWFQRHFVGEHFALVTYDGCTLANDEKLKLLARKLVPGGPEQTGQEAADSDADQADRQGHHRWFKRVMTGRSMIEQLTSPPTDLSISEAYRRLEGAFLGPRLRDEKGELLPQEARTTCLVVTLSQEAMSNNQNMRKAIQSIEDIAQEQCSIPRDTLRMGGPPVDNVAIDIEGERTLMRLALLSGIVGLTLSYWCFRSIKLTGMVFTVGVVSAGLSLALVFYYGVYEVVVSGLGRPRLGTVDAILMSMPAVVYVLGLSGAIHIVNYYKDARKEGGLSRAAETAVRHGWGPCTLAALTTAVGLASLHTSDITPIKKFGTFTALGVLGTLAILFTVLPVALHRFPIHEKKLRVGEKRPGGRRRFSIDGMLDRVGQFVVRRNALVCGFWLAVMGFFALGLWKIETSVQLLKLFDEDADIIQDYAWLEKNLGNLVPMEVVITLDAAQIRSGEPSDSAEENGQRYRMSPAERVAMARRFHERVESPPDVGKAMSVATFVRDISDYSGGTGKSAAEAILNRQLEASRESLDDYLKKEHRFIDGEFSEELTGRELWRISARVRALDDARGKEMDYGTFVGDLRAAVEPLVLAYRQRDAVLRQLHQREKKLADSKLLLLYRAPDVEAGVPEDAQEALVSELLQEAHATVRGFNLARLSGPDAEEIGAQFRKGLAAFDAAVIVSVGHDPSAKRLTEEVVPLIDVSTLHEPPPALADSPVNWVRDADEPLPIGAVYTGVVPLVYKTQRELLVSLQESITWASGLIAVVMIFVLRSPTAGLISMLPNVFPIIVVFGALGWLGIKVDIGIMMTASVAIGVAVDDTVHFVWWFRKGIRGGMQRHDATMFAYQRCGTAMTQTTIIAGLGLAVFATSTFTPTQQFGYLMITMLSAALVGDLLLLPAILAGPIGKFFCGRLGSGRSETPAPTDQPPRGTPSRHVHSAPTAPQATPEPAHSVLKAHHPQDPPRRSARAS